METQPSETELYAKLASTFHLNVPERRLLPDGRVRISLLAAAIEKELQAHGWYPVGLRVEHDFAGGLIELREEGGCYIHWKSEFSFLRYELDAVDSFSSPAEAITAWLRAMFPEDMDGIRIDWGS